MHNKSNAFVRVLESKEINIKVEKLEFQCTYQEVVWDGINCIQLKFDKKNLRNMQKSHIKDQRINRQTLLQIAEDYFNETDTAFGNLHSVESSHHLIIFFYQ